MSVTDGEADRLHCAMPFVIAAGERYVLPIGETVIGGTAAEGLAIPQLASSAPIAVVTVLPDESATLRRVGSGSVLIDGTPLGAAPVPLAHGTRLVAGGVQLSFGDIRQAGTTAHVIAVPDEASGALAGAVPGEPTSDRGGRLLLGDGHVVAIPDGGLVVGRDPEAGLVLSGSGISRRHFAVGPSLQGYTLTDTSANGTFVNGRRVEGAQLLGFGDTIRIGETTMRFEAEPASFEPALVQQRTGELVRMAPGAPAPVAPRPPLLATLEIINEGVTKGTRFRIDRTVTTIGRAEHCDVRLDSKSVSLTHATLTRRGRGWTVHDLDSTNGTYVDGERIGGEQPLKGVAELRFGPVKMVFRPIGGGGAEEDSTRAVVGITDEEPEGGG